MSKKISQLPASTDVYDGCCMPIVTNDETKKMTYALLKEKLQNDLHLLDVDDALSESSENPVQNKVVTTKINEVNLKATQAATSAANAWKLASNSVANKSQSDYNLDNKFDGAFSQGSCNEPDTPNQIHNSNLIEVNEGDLVRVIFPNDEWNCIWEYDEDGVISENPIVATNETNVLYKVSSGKKYIGVQYEKEGVIPSTAKPFGVYVNNKIDVALSSGGGGDISGYGVVTTLPTSSASATVYDSIIAEKEDNE